MGRALLKAIGRFDQVEIMIRIQLPLVVAVYSFMFGKLSALQVNGDLIHTLQYGYSPADIAAWNRIAILIHAHGFRTYQSCRLETADC